MGERKACQKWVVLYLRSEGRFWIGLWVIEPEKEVVLLKPDEEVRLLKGMSVRWPEEQGDLVWRVQSGHLERVIQLTTAYQERWLTVNVFSTEAGAKRHVQSLKKILQRQRQTFIPLGLLRERQSR